MSWLFLSFVILQTYTYYRYSQKDTRLLKSFVYGSVIFQFFHTALNSYTSYAFEAQGWGEPDIILGGPAPTLDNLHLLVVAIVGFSIQIYFIWRIWAFAMFAGGDSLKTAITVACTFLTLGTFCGIISALMRTVATLAFSTPDQPSWSHPILLLWTSVTVAVDAGITACLIAFLFHPKAQMYFGEARDNLGRIIKWTIQTGLATTILAIIVVPLAALQFDIYSMPWYMMSKLYVMSLLAHLNARSRTKSVPSDGPSQSSVQLPSMAFASRPRAANRTGATSSGIMDFIRSRISQRQATTTVHPHSEIHTIPEADSSATDSMGMGTESKGDAEKRASPV